MLESVFQFDAEKGRFDARCRDMPFGQLALVGNALPRKCGLATYTSHVADALRQRYPAMIVDHYAMDDGSGVEYLPDILTIVADNKAAYRAAAERIEAR